MPAPPPLLEVAGLTKRFTGTLALVAVDFDVRPGEIHALLGQNGAGKSTLIKILAGVYPPSAGTIFWHGRAVQPSAEHLPIAFIHQDLGLVESMTVAENVALLAGYPRRHGLIRWREAASAAAAALAAMDSDIDPDRRVKDLTAAEKSIVAIARALAVQSDMLVLDEPTAALPAADADRLLGVLRGLRAAGLGIVYVTHRLDEVFRLADRVTVLRDGRRIATQTVGETTSAALVHMIVGAALAETRLVPPPAHPEPLLALDRLVVSQEAETGLVGPVSLALARGETLALVGLLGAGHHAVGRALFGALPVHSGTMLFDGARLVLPGPAEAMARGIGFISSKRGTESLALNLSVQENVFLNPTIRGAAPWRIAGRGRERSACRRALARFAVRPPEPDRPAATLSGGNQQKVVLARWLEARIRLLILEEPTIGVDVGSKAEIYRDLQQALAAGLAVLLISSDFEEVETICHRALVFNRGRVVAEVPRAEVTAARLTALAAGGLARAA